ncbi:MAG: TetR/AcrR family transcriptional regulator, partial [bacterium]
YSRYGIKSVTMDDVVHEVGISKKTLYQFFRDKSELVAEVIRCETLIKTEEHDEAIKGSSNALEMMLKFYDFQAQMIRESNPSLLYDLKKYYPEIHKDFMDHKRTMIFENVMNNLEQGKSEGLYRKNLNEKVIATLNLLRVEAFINSDTIRTEEVLTPEFFREMFTYHMYGIVNEKGRELLEQNLDKLK